MSEYKMVKARWSERYINSLEYQDNPIDMEKEEQKLQPVDFMYDPYDNEYILEFEPRSFYDAQQMKIWSGKKDA